MFPRFGMAIIAAGMFATAAFPSSLQDWEFNINGTDYFPAGGATLSTVPGLDASGFNSTTGIGSITITFDPGAAGSYFVGGFFFDPVGVPFYNEYGQVNGSPDAGQSYAIDVPEVDVNSNNHGAGNIVGDLEAGALTNTNTVPGTMTNYLNDCGANGGGAVTAACNDFVSMALGFNFSLTSDQEAVITLDLSSTDPGGFSLQDVHPIDGSNTSAASVFYSGGATVQCVPGTPNCGGPPPPVPEPSYTSFAAIGLVALTLILRKRLPKKA
jgi:hypothetical protein